MSVRSFQQIVNAQAGGHHPIHTGLQKHSVGGAYPLAPVAYETPAGLRWQVENLGDSTVFSTSLGIPFQYVKVADALRVIVNLVEKFPFEGVSWYPVPHRG